RTADRVGSSFPATHQPGWWPVRDPGRLRAIHHSARQLGPKRARIGRVSWRSRTAHHPGWFPGRNGRPLMAPDRIDVRKTYKLYIGGAFPRSESGRSYVVNAANGDPLANAVRGSRKDLREAVRAARKAFQPWADKTAMNRGQVLYRVAELMEGRRDQFVAE